MNRTLFKMLAVTLLLMLPTFAFALVGAHDPASGGKGYTCTSACHTGLAVNVLFPAANVCIGCHNGGGGSKATSGFTVSDYKSIGTDVDYNSSPVSGRTPSKNNSHKWLGPDVVPGAKAQAPVDQYSLNQYGLNRRGLTGQILCIRCHAVHSDSRNTEDSTTYTQSAQAPFLRSLNSKDQMCLDCHRQRNTQTGAVGTHPVMVSYTSTSAKAKVASGELKATPYAHPNPTAQMQIKQGYVVCSSCHGVHFADSDSNTFDTYSSAVKGNQSASNGALLRASLRGADNGVDTINLCTNCHTKKHTSPQAQVFQHNKPGALEIQCVDCHNAHTDNDGVTPNRYMLRNFVNYSGVKGQNGGITKLPGYTRRVVYTDDISTARWANAEGTGVCQACHTPTASQAPEHATYVSDTSKKRTDCITCHNNAPHTDMNPAGGGCNTCHGQPPSTNAAGVDGRNSGYLRYPDESTTPHSSHTSKGISCDKCHGNKSTAHNGVDSTYPYYFVFQDAASRTNSNSSAAYYTPATPGNVLNTTASTCNLVYCHSTGQIPNPTSNASFINGQEAVGWRSGTSANAGAKGSIIGQPTECATCHLNTTIATGAHAKHLSAAFGYTCATCHSDTVSDNTTISNSSNHVNAVKNIKFSGLATGSNCATVYCHGSGADAVTLTNWATPSARTCGSCHGVTSATLTTGAHAEHLTYIGGTQPTACQNCHIYTGEVSSTHVNGIVALNSADLPAANCTNSCHQDVYAPATASATTLNWGAKTPSGCAACHNGTGAFTGTGGAPATGSHNVHMAASATCASCHTGVSGTSPSFVYSSASHLDGNIDVAPTGGSYTADVTKHAANNGYGGRTCTSSCHLDSYSSSLKATTAWGTTGCAACHSNFTATGNAPATGSHDKHMLKGTTCADCHTGVTGTALANFAYVSANHRNTTVEVAGYSIANVSKHSSAGPYAGTCTNTCHSATTTAVQTPVWNVGSNCGSCHEATPTTGSHTAHITTASIACGTCHSGAVAGSSGGSNHLTVAAKIDVTSYSASPVTKHATGSYSGNCSTSVCHGGGTKPSVSAPTWGYSSGSVSACTKCHGKVTLTNYSSTGLQAAPGYAQSAGGTYTNGVSTQNAFGAHDAHVRAVNNYTTRKVLCSDCHGTLPTAITGTHGDGTTTYSFSNLAKNVGTTFESRATLTPSYAGSGGACTAVYCHGDGNVFVNGAKNNKGTATTPSWTSTTYLPTYTKDTTVCGKCHAALPNTALKDHTVDTSLTANYATSNCTSCHGHEGNGPTHIDGNFTASGGGCDGCHSYDTGATWNSGTGRYNTDGTWGKNIIVAAGAHVKHINYIKARLGYQSALDPTGQTYGTGAPMQICGTCHSNNEAVDHPKVAPGSRNIFPAGSTFLMGEGNASQKTLLFVNGTNPSFSTSNKTCSNISCHYFTSPAWSN